MTNAFSRRQFLLGGLVLAGTGAVAACTSDPGPAAPAPGPSLRPTPTPTALGEPTVRRTLTARPLSLDIGGIEAKTWGYVSDTGDAAIEATAGDVLQVDITNELPESTSIHWHGIALHNAADGVPGMTQDPIEPGESFSYVFEVPHGGTYFYHSHTGLQLDRGLHAPLIIRDPQDAEDQDVEWTIVLDDWVDGIQGTPDDELDKLTGMVATRWPHACGVRSRLPRIPQAWLITAAHRGRITNLAQVSGRSSENLAHLRQH